MGVGLIYFLCGKSYLNTRESMTKHVISMCLRPCVESGASFPTVSRVSELWDSLLQTLEGNTRNVTALMFSPDGQKLMSVFDAGTVCIWDATTGTLRHTPQNLKLELGYCYNVSFDGQRIATFDYMEIQVWDLIFGALIRTIKEHDMIDMTAFSPTESKLASSVRGTIRVWDITSGVLLHTYEGHARLYVSLKLSPNGQKLASWSEWENTLLIWDLGSASLLPSVKLDPQLWAPSSQSVKSDPRKNVICKDMRPKSPLRMEALMSLESSLEFFVSFSRRCSD